MIKLLDMNGSSKPNIKEQKEQSKLSGHMHDEKIRTITLKKDNNVEQLFQSERNI